MPVHDWNRVEAGIFHDFHTVWIGEIRSALNEGALPEGYYALAEQHAGENIADLLTLHVSPESGGFADPSNVPSGGTAVAEAPPKVRRRQTLEQTDLRRTLAIRHVSGHRLVALLEIVSPGNKDRAQHVSLFARKVVEALSHGIHVLIVDLFPPGAFDPHGMHGAVLYEKGRDEFYDLPGDEPLTLASYAADVSGKTVEVYLEHLGVGAALPAMPLFLTPEHYVNAPLDATYAAAYRGMPAFWRGVLEGRS